MRAAAIIAPNWLGDAVMSLPALAELRAAHPEWRLTVLARAGVAPVYAAAGLGLELELLPQPPSLRLAARARGAEICIVLPNSFYSGLLAWRSGARRRIGYARDGRGWLLTDRIATPAAGAIPAHESFYFLELLRRAGLIGALPAERPVKLQPEAEAVTRWRERFGGDAPVAVHAGASYGSAKCWPPERFAALVRELATEGRRVVLVGSAGERGLAEAVRQQAGDSTRVENLAGETSLPELIALLASASVLVANDSGPMHLAAAVGTPVVALFGSTNERETYPLARPGRLRIVKAPGIECSPCKLRTCPIDHRCMTRIGAEEALAAVRALGAGA